MAERETFNRCQIRVQKSKKIKNGEKLVDANRPVAARTLPTMVIIMPMVTTKGTATLRTKVFFIFTIRTI
jgi:hypothetical protein